MNAHHERRIIASIFSATAVLIAALWVFGLRPAQERAKNLRGDLATLQPAPGTEASDLDRTHAGLRRERAALQAELDGLRARTRTFTGESPVGDSLPSTREKRIDYKVALLESRNMLFASAASAGMALPAVLGLPDTIAEGEEPKTRLWQLAAVVKTLRACMTVGVPAVREVRPLPPLVQPAGASPAVFYREYPVFLRMECSFESAILFLQSLQRPGHFFPLRAFKMESVSSDPGALLEVLAIPAADIDIVQKAAMEPRADTPAAPRNGRSR